MSSLTGLSGWSILCPSSRWADLVIDAAVAWREHLCDQAQRALGKGVVDDLQLPEEIKCSGYVFLSVVALLVATVIILFPARALCTRYRFYFILSG